MVQRQSTAVDFGNIQSPQIAGAQVGAARTDLAKFYDPTGSAQTPAPSFMDGLLKIIAPAAGQLGKAAMTVGQDEAYLRGSSAAGTRQAEEDVESNFMTKDWATAGYRDTTTRLKAADAEAQTAVDMVKLREQTPAKFGEYLAARREDLYSDVQGMSLPARKSMLAQQLVSERSAIQTHATEHKKFVIDQDLKSVAADVGVKFDAMDKAKRDVPTYNLATGNAFTSIYGNVWQNTRLPPEARAKATMQAMEGALSRNHQQLFTMFKAQPVTMPDGTSATMFSQLAFDDQVKLTKAYGSSLSATEAARNAQFNSQIGLMLGSFNDPSSPPTSRAELDAVLADGIQRGAITSADVRSYTRQWQESQAKRGNQAASAAATATNNVQAMSDLGKTQGESAQDWRSEQSRLQVPLLDIVNSAITMGVTTGNTAMLKIAGNDLSNAVAAIKPDSPGNPTHAALLQSVLSKVGGKRGSGQTADVVSILSGMSEESRARFETFWAALDETGDANAAAAFVLERDVKNATISQDMRKALRGTANTDNAKAIADLAPTQLWGSVSKRALDFLGMAPGDQAKITTQRYWFQNPDEAERGMAEQRASVAASVSRLTELNPYHSTGSIMNLALADVAGRTIDLDSGLLTIPYLGKGVPMQSYFGVGIGVTPSTIGKALSGAFQPLQPGNKVTFHTGSGVIRYQEFSERGESVRSGTLDPKSLAKVIGEEDAKAGLRFDSTDGAGVTRTGDTGAKVVFNGASTVSGRSNALVLQLRENIAKHEGVRDTPYDDSSRKVVGGKRVQTVGVGVSSHNPFYPKISVPDYGNREDGTIKGSGWLGALRRPDGDVSTELSIGVNIRGKQIDIPALVPSLTKSEIDSLLRDEAPSKGIVQKAVKHAQERMAGGKSPFKEPVATATPQQINESFMAASNAAATAGDALARGYRLNDSGFMLMSELAYQSGINFVRLPIYAPFTAALRNRDKAAAVDAFKKTPAFTMSHKARQDSYVNLINKSME